MVVDADSKVEARTVKAERSLGDKWMITDGLAPGERIIVEGLQRARPGAPVQVIGAPAALPAAAAATAG
jgi:membrane fusion protein (multidrug efflux system)